MVIRHIQTNHRNMIGRIYLEIHLIVDLQRNESD